MFLFFVQILFNIFMFCINFDIFNYLIFSFQLDSIQQMNQTLQEYLLEQDPPTLNYKSSPNQGQCILLEVHPLKKQPTKYLVYIVASVLTFGLFALLVYWYPRLQRYLYFNNCSVEDASNFYIINYDNQQSIVIRNDFKANPQIKQGKKSIGFMNRYMKYVIQQNIVKSISFNTKKRLNQICGKPIQQTCLCTQDIQRLRQHYGPGTMMIQRPTILVLFARQVFQPLYLFIVFSILLWYAENYQYYATIILLTSTLSIAANLIQLKQLNNKIYSMAYYQINLHVLRNGQVIRISSFDVVPGDIVFLKDAIKVPFDGIILQGSALINQCTLTGQSVPVIKKADTPQSILSSECQPSKTCLIYQGTQIIHKIACQGAQSRFKSLGAVYGIPVLITSTNFLTLKGQLIRLICFPQSGSNKFQKQSTKFLIFLFCLSVVSYLLLIFQIKDIVTVKDMIWKFFDLITITVPPGLPVSMTCGIVFAIEKLKNKNIFCLNTNSIISGGRVNHLCFDKTGTLTQNFMDFYGVLTCSKTIFQPFVQYLSNTGSQYKKLPQLIKLNCNLINALGNMSSNHSLMCINNQLIGDPMQKRLFEFGQFQLYHSNDSNILFSYQFHKQKGKAFKRFQFDSNLQRMTVIATKFVKLTEEGKTKFIEQAMENETTFQGFAKTNDKNDIKTTQLYVYSKGSPQIMQQIMKKRTIPQNYSQVLNSYTSRGFRVLAIASKPFTGDIKSSQRNEVQSDLQFDGFQIFQNKLKIQTFDAIQDLKRANISMVMITGDNPLTGSNVAFKCQIAEINKRILICDFKDDHFQYQQFIYTERQTNIKNRQLYNNKNNIVQSQQPQDNVNKKDNPMIQLRQLEDPFLKPYSCCKSFIQRLLSLQKWFNYQFCLTGPFINKAFPQHQVLTQVQKELLLHTCVFSRTKPNDKAKIVQLYQEMGNAVMMCGDGANDSGALKQADVGLALSQAETSVAAAFTTTVFNITQVVQLIKQCRAGLATNFSLFNIMAIYSLIQYTTTVISQIFYSYPSDLHYLYWDLAGNFLFFLTFGYTGTVQRLSKQSPRNSLFSLTNMSQLIIMFLLQLGGQIMMVYSLCSVFNSTINYSSIGGFINNRDLYLQNKSLLHNTPQTNILFLFTNFLYISSFIAFSISAPWRKQFYTNRPFMIVLAVVTTYSVGIVLVKAIRLDGFQIGFMNHTTMNWIVLMAAGFMSFIIYVTQKCVMQPWGHWLKNKYPKYQFI